MRCTELDDDDFDELSADSDGEYIPCPQCGETILEDAEYCPYCDQWITNEAVKSQNKPWWVLIVVLVLLGTILLSVFGI